MKFAVEILTVEVKKDNESTGWKRSTDDGGCYVF